MIRPASIAAIGAVFGALGVALGAFGAHGLADRLTPERLETWKTAARYQLVHAVAMIALAALASVVGDQTVANTGIAWTIGVLIFSGSLYALCLSGVGALGAVTPLGGLALIGGWVLLAVGAFRAALAA